MDELIGRWGPRGTPEEHDPVPVGDTVYPPPMTIQEMIQKYVREALSPQMADEGHETFEESEDFEVDDDDELPLTHHNIAAMPEDELRGHAAHYGIELASTPSRQVPQEGQPPRAATQPANAGGGVPGAPPEAPQEDP